MLPIDWRQALPGADLVARGIADLERGEESVEALLVWCARTVFEEIGWAVPAPVQPGDELRLYALVGRRHPEDPHAQYNALRRRVDKFLRAARRASRAHEARVFGTRGSHRRWWTALAAVPPTKTAHNWWAPDDGRASRYVRLKRCWADYTMATGPKGDPDRPHGFYTPRYGLHRIVGLWENFELWHPGVWVPALLTAAGFEAPVSPVVDACWSYEYRTATGLTKPAVKQVDAVLHVRLDGGDERVLVVEAKAPKDTLKAKPPLPDTVPGSYRDLPAFRAFRTRHMLYLVPESYTATVRRKVAGEYGLLSWENLLALQVRLAARARHGGVPDLLLRIGETLDLESVPVQHDGAAGVPDGHVAPDPVVESWIKGAELHLAAVTSGSTPTELPFEYLRHEKSFADIHAMTTAERSCFGEDHMRAYWRLPARR